MTIKRNIPTAAPMTVNDKSDDSTVTLVDIVMTGALVLGEFVGNLVGTSEGVEVGNLVGLYDLRSTPVNATLALAFTHNKVGKFSVCYN